MRVCASAVAEREPRHVGKGVHHWTQQAIVRTEVVPPFGHAMRLVDREQRDAGAREQLAKALLAGAFGRDVEQVERAAAERVERLAPVGVGAGQCRCTDPTGPRRAQLVVHQRDQRRYDHAGALEFDRRELVAQRLAGARGHHGKRRAPIEHALDDLFLPPPEVGEAERRFERRARRVERSHGPGVTLSWGRIFRG